MQLKETLAILCDDENLKSRDYLWQHLRDTNKLFTHIHYETIPDTGLIIEDET
jgi:hypothetical protein